jgi:hypothetical protein
LRVKDQSIERESETAEDRKSLPKRLVAEQPGRYPIVRIEERSIDVPSRAIANSAESVAPGTQKRDKHRLDATAQPQIGVADNTGGDLGLAAVSTGTYRRHPVHEFDFADRTHLDRTRVPVHRVRLHKYGRNDIVAGVRVSQEIVQHVAPSGPDPEVVMGVYDRQFGFERGLLVPVQPILAHRASRCRLLRRCGERQPLRRREKQ